MITVLNYFIIKIFVYKDDGKLLSKKFFQELSGAFGKTKITKTFIHQPP